MPLLLGPIEEHTRLAAKVPPVQRQGPSKQLEDRPTCRCFEHSDRTAVEYRGTVEGEADAGRCLHLPATTAGAQGPAVQFPLPSQRPARIANPIDRDFRNQAAVAALDLTDRSEAERQAHLYRAISATGREGPPIRVLSPGVYRRWPRVEFQRRLRLEIGQALAIPDP